MKDILKKQHVYSIIGLLLIFGFIITVDTQVFTNWSSSERVGYNFVIFLELIVGSYLVYRGYKLDNSNQK